MAGIAPQLPLNREREDGYTLLKDLKSVIQQNLKNLMLTSPGERIMDVNFGVGLSHFLFEQNGPILYSKIEHRVRTQIATYFPFLVVESVDFNISSEDIDNNILYFSVEYSITPLSSSDILNLTISLGVRVE